MPRVHVCTLENLMLAKKPEKLRANTKLACQWVLMYPEKLHRMRQLGADVEVVCDQTAQSHIAPMQLNQQSHKTRFQLATYYIIVSKVKLSYLDTPSSHVFFKRNYARIHYRLKLSRQILQLSLMSTI